MIISFAVLLFVMWVVLADVRKFANKKEYPPYVVAPALAYSFLFIVVDIMFNATFGSIIFLQIPRDFTLTGRLRRNLEEQSMGSWRFELSYWVCKHLISPWDPNHCGLGLK